MAFFTWNLPKNFSIIGNVWRGEVQWRKQTVKSRTITYTDCKIESVGEEIGANQIGTQNLEILQWFAH